METSNYNFTDSQKESCAVSLMRDTVEALSLRDNISYEEALLRFTSQRYIAHSSTTIPAFGEKVRIIF